MSLPIWGDLLREIGQTVRQVLPNPQAQAEFDLKIMELAERAEQRENELMLGQIQVNQTEAQHSNIFVAGWRPFVGWASGLSVAYIFLVRPLLTQIFGVPMPDLEIVELMMLLGAMLGIGGMRTAEKFRGLASSIDGTVRQPTER
jgi:hypothetical protein